MISGRLKIALAELSNSFWATYMEAPAQGLQGSTKTTNGAMLAVCNTPCIFISMRNPLRRVTNGGKSSLYIGFTSSLWHIRKLLSFWTCIISSRNQCSYTRIRCMASSCSCAVIAFPISLKKNIIICTQGRSWFTYQRHRTKGLTNGDFPNFLRYSSRNSPPAW